MDRNLKANQHFWHFVTSLTFVLLMLVGLSYLNAMGKSPTSISLFDFFLLTFATFRVTRLLVHDLVMDFIRDFFEDAKWGLALSIRSLLHCPWCTGAWVALGITFFYLLIPLFWPILLVLAVAGFGTLLTILASMMMVSLENNSKEK